MASNIQYFYPEVVYDGKQKWLFNAILKKRYKNLPEERVRLQWVDYLLQNNIWKKGHIGFETPVKASNLEGVLRADLVLYSEKLKPDILIECKADSVKLNPSTAEQAARYNRKLGTRLIILTNGHSHQVYEVADGHVQPRESEFPFRELSTAQREDTYWQKRGFYSPSVHPELEGWLVNQLRSFSPGCTGDGRIRYLNFKSTFLPVPMDHYYKIVPLSGSEKIAYTFIGFPESDTFALFILNEKGKNRAVAIINLSTLSSGSTIKIDVISSGRDRANEVRTTDVETIKNVAPSMPANFIRKFFD